VLSFECLNTVLDCHGFLGLTTPLSDTVLGWFNLTLLYLGDKASGISRVVGLNCCAQLLIVCD
jgi:hypothetical protein